MASMAGDQTNAVPPGKYSLAFSRIENHYFINDGFLNEDNHILNRVDKIAHLEGYIVHGRYDMICPPIAAYKLAKKWSKAKGKFFCLKNVILFICYTLAITTIFF